MKSAARRRLGDSFVERGLITGEQLEEALALQRESGAKLGEILVELGFVTRVALAGVVAAQWDGRGVADRTGRATERRTGATPVSVVESAFRARVDLLTAELAARDQQIAQQEAKIAALTAQLGP
jgi:hypothetical protein